MGTLPKKMLRIRDLTFILPDDFDGTVEDAMTAFLEYRISHRPNKRYSDPNGIFSSLQCLVMSSRDERVCGDGAVYELKDGQYKLMDATNPYWDEKRDKERKAKEAAAKAAEDKDAEDS